MVWRSSESAVAPAFSLDSSVQYLKGVGPRRAADLAALGISTAGDLLNFFPIRYEDHGARRRIAELAAGEPTTIIAELAAVRLHRGRSPIVRATARDATGALALVWFNAPYMAERLAVGQLVELSGTARRVEGRLVLINPLCRPVAAAGDESGGASRYAAVYSAKGGVRSAQLARIIHQSLASMAAQVPELVSDAALRRHQLVPRQKAYRAIHAPNDLDDAAAARRRLAFDECLIMQLAVGLRRMHVRRNLSAPPLALTPMIADRIRRRLPFELTPAQQRVVGEIAADLARARPMARLLQGDVGSGKTIVAICAALQAMANRHQVAILAPTAVLAEQHHRRIERLLAGSRVRCALMLGGAGTVTRRTQIEALKAAELDLLVGTHALLDDRVVFGRLGLAVIDEQHRFGVWQRALLRRKGDAPHCLIMTATPIPRTLMMTAFGDLDISVIDELPPGRRPVETRVLNQSESASAWRLVAARLGQGEQAYVVYPRVEQEDGLPLGAARQEARRLQRDVFAAYRVGLLHGRLKPADKQAAMGAFRRGSVHVLVCTTVVEVGVDVPRATVMVIQHADRYGLAQLHQLRGRVGRADRAGLCLLISDNDSEAVRQRLDIMCRTCDGFAIAEEDLRLRGPGELLGTRQHGMPTFRLFRLLEDQPVLRAARAEANRLLEEDPALRSPAHAALRDALQRQYGQTPALLAPA